MIARKSIKGLIFLVLILPILLSAILLENTKAVGTSDPRREMIYFVMIDRFANGDPSNDKGGLKGGRDITGYDQYAPGFYHGGDLKGLGQKLDYIKDLGFTAVWITPVFRQMPLAPDGASASYHGYWGLGFDQVNPHFGTMQEFKDFVAKAHSMGLKIYLDIVVNHTADVITYREGNAYISLFEKPYKTANGKKFDVVALAGLKTFPTLAELSLTKSFPKTAFVSKSQKNIKSPSWLNELKNYHNRGNSSFSGDSSKFGDFFGLDDVMTESPRVVNGFITLFTKWIKETGIDGFRIDTVRHVNEEFWKVFLPAMRKAAVRAGKTSFPMWGEVYDSDPYNFSHWIKDANFSELLDFPFQKSVINFINQKTALSLAKGFNDDDSYLTSYSSADRLGTFLGNHDMGRVGYLITRGVSTDNDLRRDQMAHALLFTLRGIPIVYYGDEFGIVGGNDKEARQDLFATSVDRWKRQQRIGSEPVAFRSSFDTTNPLQETIKSLTTLRKNYSAFALGGQRINFAQAGVFIFSRFDFEKNREYLVAANVNSESISVSFNRETVSSSWKTILGSGSATSEKKSITVILQPYQWSVFEGSDSFKSTGAETVLLEKPRVSDRQRDQLQLVASVPNVDFAEVDFQIKNGDSWKSLGIDNSPTFSADAAASGLYRNFPPILSLDWKNKVIVRAVATLGDGRKLYSTEYLVDQPKL